ncbi:hypothetical protein [Achromobacter sp. MFA1 R4]|uniref:hypothetical protein n=1 Tax=Achromobacter sp. MFA1 R4 TaxID=1881016 RepID=UPI000970A5E2|nr:hypothetical protein [Achromobacter sp. MFA1 R4]
MTREPVDKYFGIRLSDWIERLPNELDVDAVGLWQIIPVGMDSFGLEGNDLDLFAYRCIMALLQKGAVPVRAIKGAPGWVPDLAYRGPHEDIANQIVREWRSSKLAPDHDGLWFSLVRQDSFWSPARAGCRGDRS